MKLRDNLGFSIFIGIVLIFVIGYLSQQPKEYSLKKNRKLVLSVVTKVSDKGKESGSIKYKFIYNDKVYKNSDPLNPGWPRHVRKRKPNVGEYYYAEFDSLKPSNSKIIIGEYPVKLKE
ncbi:hypothetical protein [uncultured Aquimarina sp.]|uniref:hypothetical protein n=1 Tax=uncultured Aquimarina sp. TaxID=575652 RepID=UPI002616998A|nr:hypothetical protein [uncultured Aquimarina sp.]